MEIIKTCCDNILGHSDECSFTKMELELKQTQQRLKEAENAAHVNLELGRMAVEKLKEAEKVIEFYADQDSWGKSNQNHFNRMPFKDVEFFKSHKYQGVWYNNGEIAGKRAREYQAKYKEKNA